MTIDSVVQKTGMTLGLTILVAAATWVLTPDPGTGADAGSLYLLLMVGAFGGFALSMVNSFKRVISPALVLAYAALEGLFVGAFSKVIDASFGGPDGGGLVIGAVLGTFAAVAARSRRTSSSTSGSARPSASGSSARCSASSPSRCSTSCSASSARRSASTASARWACCPASSAWASAC